MEIGFVGTGTISAAMVHGLQTLRPAPRIVVSPRSEVISQGLAARYPNVRRAASNAEAAAADLVILGMRPLQVEEALGGIVFRADQLVVSLVAGLPLSDVQLLAPLSRVDRAIPMPGIARAEGPIAIYPGQPETIALLSPLGELIVAPSEVSLNMGGVTGFMSSYFELQDGLIKRAKAAGNSDEDARRYVVSLLSMLATTARTTPANLFDELVTEHQTKGGLNERVRAHLLEVGWFDAPGEAFAAIAKLSRKNLG
jgi:pyrroline-5-carboxylate reductase